MRKGRQKRRHGHSPDKQAERHSVDDAAAPETVPVAEQDTEPETVPVAEPENVPDAAPETVPVVEPVTVQDAEPHTEQVAEQAAEPETAQDAEAQPAPETVPDTKVVTDQPVKSSIDLDSLGRELERSITGGTSQTPSSPERSPAPPPPAMNATPEDILGLQTRSFEPVEEPTAADAPAKPSNAGATIVGAGGSKPMEAFEERTAMAKEVLRATSPQPRGSRRSRRRDTESGDSPPADTAEGDMSEEDPEEDVRFSEDVTISAKRRQRRKLFGR
jgi:hypothetical protein